MLDRVIRYIQAKKVGRRIVLRLGQREFTIHKANPELPVPHETLHRIGPLQDKVHAFAVVEVVEES